MLARLQATPCPDLDHQQELTVAQHELHSGKAAAILFAHANQGQDNRALIGLSARPMSCNVVSWGRLRLEKGTMCCTTWK